MSKKPKIILLTMGGTISISPSENVAKLKAHELLEYTATIQDLADIEGRDVLSITSSSLMLDDIDLLVKAVSKALDEADSVIITHGTDTLEETAFFLSLLIHTEKPVILTGSLRRAGVPGADGPANLIAACRVAVSPDSTGKGILVVINDEIHAASLVQKSHSFLTNAFTSLGPLGWIAEDRVRFFLAPLLRSPRLTIGPQRPIIPFIETGSLFDVKILSAFTEEIFAGMVLNTTGVGHISDAAVDDLTKIAERRPIIFASRTGHGETFGHTYPAKGAERELIKRGLIPSGFLNGRQARIVLILLLSMGADLSTIKAYFKNFSE